jgi:hypothetical protein
VRELKDGFLWCPNGIFPFGEIGVVLFPHQSSERHPPLSGINDEIKKNKKSKNNSTHGLRKIQPKFGQNLDKTTENL